MQRVVRVGTRRSPLARAQTEWVARSLRNIDSETIIEVVPIHTEGDIDKETPLPELGGRGVFVTEVERALRAGVIDFAVHSLKDLPTQAVDDLVVAAVPLREDVRDALVTAGGLTLDELPRGATVGTGSPRRQAQLAHVRPDLKFVGMRGNIETRRNKALTNDVDATLLAVAGLNRSGLADLSQPIPTEVMLPAAGQGALALQCRASDDAMRGMLQQVDDPTAHAGAGTERDLLARLRGGCHAPIGAYCRKEGGGWLLEACVASTDGSDVARVAVRGESAAGLAEAAYDALCINPLVRRVLGT